MFSDRRLTYFWCVLAAGVLFASILPRGAWIDQIIGNSDMSRWAHFLAYATIVVIPFVACRKGKGVLLPVLVVMAGILIESVETLIPGSIARPQNVLANVFGVGAGLLLGMNLRMMKTQAKPDKKLSVDNSRSTWL